MNWKKLGWIALIATVGLGLLTAAGFTGYRLGLSQARADLLQTGALHARMFAWDRPADHMGWPASTEDGFMGPGRGRYPGQGQIPRGFPLGGSPSASFGIVGVTLLVGMVLIVFVGGAVLAGLVRNQAAGVTNPPPDNPKPAGRQGQIAELGPSQARPSTAGRTSQPTGLAHDRQV